MDIRRAVLRGKCDLHIETAVIADEPQPDEVLVETRISALSTGTDLGNYLGDSTYVPGAPDYPRWVGYSNAGVVLATGAKVTQFRPGDRVFATKPHQSAYIARESELLVRIPEAVSFEQASLAYLTGLGVAALRKAQYEAGENVAVVGLGVIGLATLGVARAMGANAIGIANSQVRAQAGLALGALGCVLSDAANPAAEMKALLGGAEADIVVLTSNSWQSYFLALDLARPGGRVSILGFPGRGEPLPDRNPLDPAPFYSKQLTLLGAGFSPKVNCGPQDIRFNLKRNLEYIFDLMASGRLDLSSLLSHRFAYGSMRDAYELARARSKELVAAVFDWTAE